MDKWIDIKKEGLPAINDDDPLYVIYEGDSLGSQKMSFARFDPFLSDDPEVVWISETNGYVKATHYMIAPSTPCLC